MDVLFPETKFGYRLLPALRGQTRRGRNGRSRHPSPFKRSRVPRAGGNPYRLWNLCCCYRARSDAHPKGRGRHIRWALVYFWALFGLFVTMAILSFIRWAEDYPLFILGALAFAAA